MAVAKAAELANLQQENQLLGRKLEGKFEVEGIIGQDPAIQEVIRMMRKVAPSNSTVLIQGESGTGKEVIARGIHRLSPRAQRQFVAINCSAIPDTLIENEFFGHERGAFTGATERKHGLFESRGQIDPVPGRDCRSAAGPAGEDPARAAGTRGPARRRQRIIPRRCPPGRGDQQEPGRGSI